MCTFTRRSSSVLLKRVSIPFKRESTCAPNNDDNVVTTTTRSFYSLQTGKHMCTAIDGFRRDKAQIVSIPFKRESTCARLAISIFASIIIVSIPFKRESTCALLELTEFMEYDGEFLFPSNGKAHVHLPYFRPTPRLAPQPLIQTRTARGFFLLKKQSEKRRNPYQY